MTSFVKLKLLILPEKWSKMAKIENFLWKMTNFLCEKTKTLQYICEKSIQTFLYMSCERIRTNKVKCVCFKDNDGQFIDPPIFSSLYIPIQIEKFAKSTPNSNADKKNLAQQNFFIFSVFKSWMYVVFENSNN